MSPEYGNGTFVGYRMGAGQFAIHSRGVWQDIRIMLKTIPAVLFGRGAY